MKGIKLKKISENIRKLAGVLKETEAKLEQVEAEKDSGALGRERLAKFDGEISFLNQEIRYKKEQINASSEKLLKRAAKAYDPVIEQDLELDIIGEGGRALAIMIHVLGANRQVGCTKELVRACQRPPGAGPAGRSRLGRQG